MVSYLASVVKAFRVAGAELLFGNTLGQFSPATVVLTAPVARHHGHVRLQQHVAAVLFYNRNTKKIN